MQAIRHRLLHIAISLVCLSLVPQALAESVSIGAYALWNRGSVRSIALGGTSVADPHNAAAVLENSAAMAFQQGWVSGLFDFGSPKDTSLNVSDSTLLKHNYRVYGTSLRAGFAAVGLGAHEIDFRATHDDLLAHRSFSFKDQVAEYHASFALRFGRVLAASGGLISSHSTRTITMTDANTSVAPLVGSVRGQSYKFGLLARLDKASVGVSWRSESSLKIPEEQGTQNFFKHSYQPRIVQYGLRWSSGGFNMALQADQITFPKIPDNSGLYYAPAAVFGRQDDYKLDISNKWIPRAAIEMPFLAKRFFRLVGRGGFYREPPFILEQKPRMHSTGGLLLQIWHIVGQVAIDVAPHYRNWNYGLSAELGLE